MPRPRIILFQLTQSSKTGRQSNKVFEKYVEQALSIFNYVDSIVLTDARGIIRYFHTNRQDINMLDNSQVIGKHILEMYANLTPESSTILKVLRSGQPVLNKKQELVNIHGDRISAITSTLPIEENGRIIGTMDVSSYAAEPLAPPHRLTCSRQRLYTLADIVTIDGRMNELKENIRKVAKTSSAVMLAGETGTGKELAAQSVHTSSGRKGRFISQNCAAIPATLMESILFGTKKGSFTGAEDSPGLFELADGGTLFLDEINSMEHSVQAKLLRAVEEKAVTRLGGSKPVRVDVKIISAVNGGTENLRPDLLYRLNTVTLEIPPLRERIADIGPLSKHFIGEFNALMNRDIIDLSEEVYDLFSHYDWPGNVRELRNIIESAFNLSEGRFIGKAALPAYLTQRSYLRSSGYSSALQRGLKAALADIEREIIAEALRQSPSRAEAARRLHLSKQAFQYKLDKYGL